MKENLLITRKKVTSLVSSFKVLCQLCHSNAIVVKHTYGANGKTIQTVHA